ncbi:MAG TPA: DUF6125 family protein [Desulfobacteraceae bacterium]|nr:DUF6125 family protein [Desulfobacteraceae bacterium]HPJ68538.1 DUF6125 family protein [Desulfobacteraceae bacterium]HPQ28704.1 DUF6125 family protein [Desulfobacteraceae bacterium]
MEENFGLEAAFELDIRMWKIGSRIEAKRIKELLNLGNGLDNILRAINFMNWAAGFGYDVVRSKNRAVWTCRRCPPQEQRVRMGKGEFPCEPTFDACFNNVIQVVDPHVTVRCIFCPPALILMMPGASGSSVKKKFHEAIKAISPQNQNRYLDKAHYPG